MLEPPGLLPKGADPRPWLRVGVPLYVFPDMATGESSRVKSGRARCHGREWLDAEGSAGGTRKGT